MSILEIRREQEKFLLFLNISLKFRFLCLPLFVIFPVNSQNHQFMRGCIRSKLCLNRERIKSKIMNKIQQMTKNTRKKWEKKSTNIQKIFELILLQFFLHIVYFHSTINWNAYIFQSDLFHCHLINISINA